MNRPGFCVKLICMNDVSIHHYAVPNGTIAYAWSHHPVATPLVMLHGLGDSAIHTFRPRITAGPLANTPTLFIDLPGFGEAATTERHPGTIRQFARDVASLLEHLHISETAVFGHSMGGNVAIHLASSRPEFVSHLVVAEPLLIPTHSILAADIARFSEETFVTRRMALLIRATRMQANRGDIAARAFLQPLQQANPVAMHRAARSLVRDAAAESESMLRNLAIPRGLIVGGRTEVDTSEIESHGITVIRIADAGHNMLVERATDTTYAILSLTT